MTTKKKKITKPTRKYSRPTTKSKPIVDPLNTWFCPKDLKEKPYSDHFLEMVAQSMYTWAKNKQGYSIEEFCTDHDLNYFTLMKWTKKNKSVGEAYIFLKTAIAALRNKGAISRKLDGNYIAREQAHYSPVFKEQAEWLSSIKADKDDASTGNVTVVVEPAPTTDIVPKKKTNEPPQ